MTHVFISYVRNNKRIVRHLCDDLVKHGVKIWLDRDRISPGSRWQDSIEQAIQRGAFFIACFSRQYNERDETHMNEELTIAIDQLRKIPSDRIWFIPVKLNKCEIPSRRFSAVERLTDFQWIDLYADWDSGIERILKVIQPMPPDIQRLKEALSYTNDPDVRRAAVKALRDSSHETAVSILMLASHDEDVKVRLDAVLALKKKANPQSVPELMNALNDEEKLVRACAAEALAVIADPKTRTTLVKAAKDKDEEVRRAAVAALGAVFDASVIPVLIDAMNDEDWYVRQAAITVLGNVGNTSVVPILIKSLGSDDLGIKHIAAEALAEIGDPAALPHLLRALPVPKERIYSAAICQALVDFGEGAIPALVQALSDDDTYISKGAISALSGIGKPAVAALLKALGSSSEIVRTNSISALKSIGEPAIPDLLRALCNKKPLIRNGAKLALTNHYIIPHLAKALGDERDKVRKSVAYILVTFQDYICADVIKAVMGILKKGKRVAHEYAIFVLAEKVGDIKTDSFKKEVTTLLNDHLNNKSPTIRRYAAYGLVQAEVDFSDLVKVLQHKDPIVRACIVLGLRRYNDANALAILAESLSDRDSLVRRCAAFALQSVADYTIVPALAIALGDKDSSVRRYAEAALISIGSPEALMAITQATRE